MKKSEMYLFSICIHIFNKSEVDIYLKEKKSFVFFLKSPSHDTKENTYKKIQLYTESWGIYTVI